MMKLIPNTITSLNLASGFIAIILTANGDFEGACWLILAAMIFDFLDGFTARLLKAYSPLGKELDSLADVVSFGVAPGFVLYSLISEDMQAYADLPTVFSIVPYAPPMQLLSSHLFLLPYTLIPRQ